MYFPNMLLNYYYRVYVAVISWLFTFSFISLEVSILSGMSVFHRICAAACLAIDGAALARSTSVTWCDCLLFVELLHYLLSISVHNFPSAKLTLLLLKIFVNRIDRGKGFQLN